MRYKLSLITLLVSLFFAASAQERLDTIYNPNVLFTGLPRTYEIADIKVTGAPNYDDVVILGYSGLKPGQRIEIPGQDVTTAVKRLMRQGLFSQARVKVLKTFGDRAWLELELRTNPRISEINYIGMKKSERDDIQDRLQLMKGNQITRNVIDRAKVIIEKYYSTKGFGNAEVDITLKDDPSNKNEVIVNIAVNKHDKVKVHKIYIDGNEVLTDKAIKNAMKKTNENGDILNLFKQKKFVEADYEADLDNIIAKYNEKGYRDAKILSDSVADYDGKTVDIFLNVEEGKKYYISDIDWVGNTVYTTEYLNNVLGIKPGEVYNQKLLNKRTTEDDDAVANLYMDNGYLFYQLIPVEKNVRGDSIDLEMKMFEGPQAKINRVIINGNDRLYEKVIRRELRVRPGELFSKRDLIRSAREIAQTGHFDPENMDIQPQPNEENGTVDILFNLASKANDQIEFSMGWGQTGIIGKLSLKFTNFSIKNLLYPSTYKGVIPQGEGQTFTISAQTNARYYQAYQVSFLDPWFGGKRPNSLQVSAYYSRQTGVNNSFYNSQWSNPYMYSGYGYPYDYNYNYNYNEMLQNSYENAYDPGKFIQMAGVTVGFGKRLSWPDDYFTFTAELSYNWYYLKNWEYLFDMNNGQSNALVLGLTLARNSIDNPLYTRSGSQFSVNLSLTPPASIFSPGRNWEQLSKTQTNAAKQELYRWVEYWKLRFKSRTYTPLTDVDGKWTLVLMTRADFGLLGSYNKWLRSPFETFYVGGDGMTGSYTYATETIALRGYDNGQFTPWGREGYAYSRIGMELHFPFMLQPTTTIYGLAFVEAGNAWTSVKEFAPFNLKRSAGAGVRIYLPMVGMMGIDWAYGFDRVYGEKGGSHFHFILGQEF
ncbi:MAG: outer membrane protein assembly factor BamA [Muribaculaceae bacterium]|nr:outer membrane protein assembly factor BamA [Muribaculaceae bacterium]